jgi:uncharacterized protein (DUF2062 family)
MSPGKLAAGISLGLVLGIIPFVGINTALCAILAYVLRINMAVIQLVNYIVYPLQILLFIPFIKLAIYLFGVNPMPYPIEIVWDKLQSAFLQTIGEIWWANMFGVLLWMIVAPFLFMAVFFGSKYLIQKYHKA